jgi:hypothetical protein
MLETTRNNWAQKKLKRMRNRRVSNIEKSAKNKLFGLEILSEINDDLFHDEAGVRDGETVEKVHQDHHDEKHEHQQEGEGQPGFTKTKINRNFQIDLFF